MVTSTNLVLDQYHQVSKRGGLGSHVSASDTLGHELMSTGTQRSDKLRGGSFG
jgi:hypothetical protein